MSGGVWGGGSCSITRRNRLGRQTSSLKHTHTSTHPHVHTRTRPHIYTFTHAHVHTSTSSQILKYEPTSSKTMFLVVNKFSGKIESLSSKEFKYLCVEEKRYDGFKLYTLLSTLSQYRMSKNYGYTLLNCYE